MDRQHVRRNVLDDPGQHLGFEPRGRATQSCQSSLLLAGKRSSLSDRSIRQEDTRNAIEDRTQLLPSASSFSSSSLLLLPPVIHLPGNRPTESVAPPPDNMQSP